MSIHHRQTSLIFLGFTILFFLSQRTFSIPESQFMTNIERTKQEEGSHHFLLHPKFLQSLSEEQSGFIRSITQTYNGKCSQYDDVYTCIVNSNVELNKSFSELQSKFSLQKKVFEPKKIFFGYDYDDLPADVFPCRFFLYKYYIRKIEDKIMILNDSTCRFNFSNCPIQPQEECDYKDCLELVKSIYKNRVKVDLLNEYKELKPSPNAIAKYSSIIAELNNLLGLILNEIYVSTCTTFTNAQCMNLFTKGNEVVEPTRAQIDSVLKACNK